MKTLKIGMVGCGGVATAVHLPSWKRIPQTDVLAVCDLSQQALTFVKKNLM